MTERLHIVHRALERLQRGSSDFDLNPELPRPKQKLREAAVLIAIFERDGEERVIFTKRASWLKHHPGQISFPGGKRELTDLSIEQTAIREAKEEIALPATAIDVIGCMPPHETVTGFLVTPVLARVTRKFDPQLHQGEVAEIFSAPLRHLLDLNMFSVQSRHWQTQKRHYQTVPFGPYYIWGASARILHALALAAADEVAAQ